MFSEAKIEVEGKQNWDQSLSVLLYLPTQKQKKMQRNRRRLAQNFATVSRSTTWSRATRKFKFRFPSELVSFVRPRELVDFDPQHVTRSPPIGKRIWVGRYINLANWPLLCDQSMSCLNNSRYWLRTGSWTKTYLLIFLRVYKWNLNIPHQDGELINANDCN